MRLAGSIRASLLDVPQDKGTAKIWGKSQAEFLSRKNYIIGKTCPTAELFDDNSRHLPEIRLCG